MLRQSIVIAIGAAAGVLACMPASTVAAPTKRPNIIVMFADDISAREFPAYNASVWDVPLWAKDKTNRGNPAYRAQTPVLDRVKFMDRAHAQGKPFFIYHWNSVSRAHRDERDKLNTVLPRFDKHATEHNALVAEDTIR